jgi:hypothetical protein
MDDKNVSLILLTYKGKALLMYESDSAIDTVSHDWSFIRCYRKKGESPKEAISKKVENEAGIKIQDIDYLSENFYHARLSDDNVNNIKRREKQLLDFFTFNDLQKLKLTMQTKKFIQEYGDLI